MARRLLEQGGVRRLLVLALALVGCGPQTGARLEPLPPRTAVVGLELDVPLRATGATSDLQLDYASDLRDLKTRRLHPTLSAYAGGQAVFRWTPLATDVGDHTIEFAATADGVRTSAKLAVNVAAGEESLLFREPVGDGTTFDPSRTACAEIGVLVDDTASTQANIVPGTPWPDNASLTADSPLSAKLSFCPTAAQLKAASVFPLTLTATDDTGAKAEKRYTIVLGNLPKPPAPAPSPSPTPSPSPSPGSTCDTTPPVIIHTPHGDITTAGNLHLSAEITDPSGVYNAVVFYTTTPPANPQNPDLSTFATVDMLFVGGSATDGQYAATLPNPVLNDAPGTTATIYYVIAASDNADAMTGCSYNVAFNPLKGDYSFVVKRAQ